jgi:hypothetical protein
MASNSRHLGRLLGTDTKIKTDDIAGGVQLGLSFYTDEASLPTEGNILGAKAYAELEGTLHLWNGYGWGPIAVTAWDYTPPPILYVGITNGYISGGNLGTNLNATSNIKKFPFAASTTATLVGQLVLPAGYAQGGASSKENGYTTGGNGPAIGRIEKFTFAADADATNVGLLTVSVYSGSGTNSGTFGYSTGGYSTPYGFSSLIQKYPFATDTDAAVSGNLLSGLYRTSNNASVTYGYLASGYNNYNRIEKWPFTSDGNTTDVGDLTVGRQDATGISSEEHGYILGGTWGWQGAYFNVVDRYPFATDGNSTDAGDLPLAKIRMVGSSSATHGYAIGGTREGNGYPGDMVASYESITRFAYAATVNVAEVGSSTGGHLQANGHQI